MKPNNRTAQLIAIIAALGLGIGVNVATANAQDALPKDNVIDGTLFPEGFTPVEIKNGKFPRVYYPNTEKLGPKEMRITALGTGMPNVITGNQKASGWYVELGNGEVFMFDLGSGTMENLAKLRPDWSKVDKVFVSHLHSDHVGALRRTLYRRLDEWPIHTASYLWAVRFGAPTGNQGICRESDQILGLGY